MKKCLIYARCSKRDQETDIQIEQLTGYCGRQEWTVVDTIVDVCSGKKGADERPGLNKVFQLAHQKKFDVLLFWALDRLSREGTRKTIQYLTRLDEYGVDWHSYKEEYLSSLGVFSDCIIALLSALAKQERLRISERTKAGLERTKRVNGTKLGRPRTPRAKIKQAVQLRNEGLSFSKVGEEMGISRVRAFQLVKQGKQAL